MSDILKVGRSLMSPDFQDSWFFWVTIPCARWLAMTGQWRGRSWPLAQTIANAAIAQCRTMGYRISVTVVDREGLPIIMMRDDGAGLSTPEGSDRKAYTARAFSQPSADFVKRLQDRPDTVGSRQYTRVLALAGGLPIKVGDEIVGAVGVSGTPGKDDVCSQAGIDKVADQLK